MQISWANYLRTHPLKDDFNTNLEALSDLYAPSQNPTNIFRNLMENKTLICLIRSPNDRGIQATFSHRQVKDSINQQKPYFYALQGFGSRASAVRFDPDQAFGRSTSNKPIPTVGELLSCDTPEALLTLMPIVNGRISSKTKLPLFTVIPPFLAEILFDSEHMDSTTILLKFIKHIKNVDLGSADSDSQNKDDVDDFIKGTNDHHQDYNASETWYHLLTCQHSDLTRVREDFMKDFRKIMNNQIKSNSRIK